MTFLKKIQKKFDVKAQDGPASALPSGGSSDPANWVTQKQSGLSDYALKQQAGKLHDLVTGWQEGALMLNGGRPFESMHPVLTKELSRSKLQFIINICQKLVNEAPLV